MAKLNEYLNQKLDLATSKGQRRSLPQMHAVPGKPLHVVTPEGTELLSFSSNDYLGLSTHPVVVQAAQTAAEAYGTSARSSRLIAGHTPQIGALEAVLANYRRTQSALVFSSGYSANIGTISALMDQNDLILADKLSHACLLDGARLSGASLQRFAHNNVEHLEKLLVMQRDGFTNCLIITESIFSMDGDIAPIENLIKLAVRYNCWLMVDDAHGFGFSKELLAPLAAFEGGVISGTLSKAAGALGGYVAGSQALTQYLTNYARSFIFSTGLPPATIAAAHKSLQLMQSSTELAQAALANAQLFTELMYLPTATSTIVPYVVDENEKAIALSEKLKEAGFYVQAIRPPTVPPGSARLRFTFSALHRKEDIEKLVQALASLR